MRRALCTALLSASLTLVGSVHAQASTRPASPTPGIPEGFFTPTASTVVVEGAREQGAERAQSRAARRSLYITKNLEDGGKVCGTEEIDEVSGAGKTTLVLTIDQSLSVEKHADVKIGNDVFSGAVGFSVTKTYAVQKQTRFEVPKGKWGHVIAYPLYKMYTFDIWGPSSKNPGKAAKLGSGWVMKPAGVCFNEYAN